MRALLLSALLIATTPPAVAAPDAGATAADAPAADADGTTPLHWAVYHNDAAQVARLIGSGANVNAVNDYGSTPLTEAAITGNVDIIGRLLKAGADTESANADGQTALMIIARTANREAAQLLLKHGARVNAAEKWHEQTALMWAAAESQPEMVKLLVAHGADVNARSKVNDWQRQVTAEPRAQARPSGGLTPLLYAARQGCLDCVRALLKAKAKVDLTDPDNVTPLIVAVNSFHFDVAKLLIDNGANINKWDIWGRTPLYLAVDLNEVPHGGRPDHRSLDAMTSEQLIQLLLERGANPNARLKLFPPYRALGPDRGADQTLTMDATPLYRAAKGGDTVAIRLLLAHGADPNIPQLQGITPLIAAATPGGSIDTRGRFKTEQQAVESVKLLAAAGADINGRGGLGQASALHAAAQAGWNDVVRTLVALHADINMKDARGLTPYDAAMGRGAVAGRGAAVVAQMQTAALIKDLGGSGTVEKK